MKIDVITLQAVNNYGSLLQTFATQEFFRQHGCDVRFINYARKDLADNLRLWPSLRNCMKGSILKLPFKIIFLIPNQFKKQQTFSRFRKEHLNITSGKIYVTMSDFEGYTSDADAYCTGSDQVWNSFHNSGILPPFYLAFAPEGSYKFAFSASFGKTEIDSQEVKETQKYIDDYRHISVREDSAVKILNEQYNYDRAVHILDPTLCIDPETWRKYAKYTMGGGVQKGSYILVYWISGFKDKKTERAFSKYAHELSKRTGLKIIQLCRGYEHCIKSLLRKEQCALFPDIFSFISLIANARYVLTDSFHATAFSLNLNIEPICVFPYRFSTRIESILRLTHTLHRHVEGYDDFDILNRHVNFDEVNSILDSERKKASDWLKMVLSEIREHNA
ncbi:MAG: polysaccharide pyruvyl transferase family protein [Synergistaceae bacterium]|nr:polysaccharide pyruvyl transferase family protein [Synergistaceae bacterium]